MTAPWLVRVADRSHPLLVPGIWLCVSLGYLSLVANVSSGNSLVWISPAALWGAILVCCLTPAYYLFVKPVTWRRSQLALEALNGLLPDADYARQRVLAVPRRVPFIGIVVGAVFALLQYAALLEVIEYSGNRWLDLSMVGANMIVWSTVGWLLLSRLYSSSGLGKIGASIPVDLYNQRPLRPFVQVAMLDVLMITGAAALMPLQSLDAHFRWENYQAGLLISVVSAILFFLLPQLGLHRALKARRVARSNELQAAINRCDHADIVRLHSLVSHQQIVAAMSTWPVDLQLTGRVLFYLVIPPLAWTGAALVEHLLNRFL